MFVVQTEHTELMDAWKEAGADALLVSFRPFHAKHLQAKEGHEFGNILEQAHAAGLLLYVELTQMIEEQQLDALDAFLEEIRQADGIYYSDEGVLQLALEKGMENKLIYQPDTLTTSSNDVRFYMDQGVQAVSLAHELSLEEILKIAKASSYVEVFVHGYFPIFTSRRRLISSYGQAMNHPFSDGAYELKEANRPAHMPVIQDAFGTHIFVGRPLVSYAQIKKMADAGIDRFRLSDAFVHPEEITHALKDLRKCLQGEQIDIPEGYDDSLYARKSGRTKEEA